MIIPLGNDTRAEVILSVLGQLSDGIWENSNGMEKYWWFADVEGTDLVIDDNPYDGSRRNGFYGKSEKEIRDWFANKAKQAVKIWAEDHGEDPVAIWKRDNTDEVTYMGHYRRPVYVGDVYECYDYLKQRKGKYNYGKTEEVVEPASAAPVAEGGMNPSQQELEDFFLDASTRVHKRGISASRRTFTKRPNSYVKAFTNSSVLDDEVIDVYVCDGADVGGTPDTFYMEAQTQYDVITISATNTWSGRYEPTYVLSSDENGILSEGTWRSVVSTFFKSYDVSHDFRRKITTFASAY